LDQFQTVFPLATTVVHLASRPHGLADGARDLLPSNLAFTFGGQPVRQPREQLCRHRADRTTIPKAEEQTLSVST